MATITVHCIIKNEENFIWYAIKSVVDYVDKILIFDTGSIDKTPSIVKNLVNEYPDKIIFEEKGECDKIKHTQLRQEMIKKTTTDWFMILDGDEVWTKRGLEEARSIIDGGDKNIECLMAPFYLCVGDIEHRYFKKGKFSIFGRIDNHTLRFVKLVRGVNWGGDYGQDSLRDSENRFFFTEQNSTFLKNKFWHLTHLKRSWVDTDYSSGGIRKNKIIASYFLVGRRIKEAVPEVFSANNSKYKPLSFFKSFFNFIPLLIKKGLGL